MTVLCAWTWSLGTTTAGILAAERRPVGELEDHVDVGPAARPGAARYDAATGEYALTGWGPPARSTTEPVHLAGVWLRGDFLLRAEAAFAGDGADSRRAGPALAQRQPRRTMGWMVRADLEPDGAFLALAVDGAGETALTFRREAGGETEQLASAVRGPDVLQLARVGGAFSLAVARAGELLMRDLELELDLGDEVYAGLFVASSDPEAATRAVFRNVRVVGLAPPDLVPYREYLASRLEILDLESGRRTVVHRTPDSMQAPNWTPDGGALLYNRNGLIYRFDLERRTASVLDTGFADRNNNDHVLSFDGERLGISHHDPGSDGRSIVYTLPAGGGAPTRVTDRGPSYLHGWSPDGRYLVYTGERAGEIDVYRIPVEGGDEVRLTSTPGLDDGAEVSPDGQWIYFNSVRSGRMQIWRMRPDGADPEQLTHDELNDWFPHVSPDGERIVFLSYGQEVDPEDHPFYREVYLRVMPATGGEPRVVAYVYGGQGTINVPSWAPDGRRLAFVSNTASH
ncbi:MAG TPA: biopolymer transporter TolR [Thermoanaerobaculia bacterium]|nr:biopolymer transporter TolR [Thermoanaerobaculia bacterium]